MRWDSKGMRQTPPSPPGIYTHTQEGKSRFIVVSTRNRIYSRMTIYCIVFRTNSCRPTFAHPCRCPNNCHLPVQSIFDENTYGVVVVKTVYTTVRKWVLLFPAGTPSPPSGRGHSCKWHHIYWDGLAAWRGRDPALLGQANAGSLGEASCPSESKQTKFICGLPTCWMWV